MMGVENNIHMENGELGEGMAEEININDKERRQEIAQQHMDVIAALKSLLNLWNSCAPEGKSILWCLHFTRYKGM